MAFIPQDSDKVRRDPLGPTTLNQLQANPRFLNGLALREHLVNGEHNALEVPWVVGKIDSGTTGYLFDTTYGGGTISRPGTGRARFNVADDVMGSVADPAGGAALLAASIMASPSGADIGTTPQTTEVEIVSGTLVEVRLWRMTSTLGSPGNSWGLHDEGFDVALHAQGPHAVPVSTFDGSVLKQRRDYLTEGATDWNALVKNQGRLRKTLNTEHDAGGAHLVDRIAKASGWFRPIAGPSYEIVSSEGVSGVTYNGTGDITVRVSSFTLASTNLGVCFPVVQPLTADELVVVAGRPVSSVDFRFYIYAYSLSEATWARANRPFYASMFGRPV